LGTVVIQLHAGERTPSVDQASMLSMPQQLAYKWEFLQLS